MREQKSIMEYLRETNEKMFELMNKTLQEGYSITEEDWYDTQHSTLIMNFYLQSKMVGFN